MSRVDFYVLGSTGVAARQRFACRLAEKAYRADNSVLIRVADSKTARHLDDLLWTFRDGSFVPHEITNTESPSSGSPVRIGIDGTERVESDLLINLTDRVPDDASSFARVAEIVTSDEESKSLSRQRFVAYRDAGHELESHKL